MTQAWDGLGRPVEAREKGRQASLRRRSHDLPGEGPAGPGRQRREDVGGRFVMRRASQSDGWLGRGEVEVEVEVDLATRGRQHVVSRWWQQWQVAVGSRSSRWG